jgi:hypothetical protein
LRKRRGYFFLNSGGDEFVFKCHNCGKSASFYTFLSDHFPADARKYALENFKKGQSSGAIVTDEMTKEKPKAPPEIPKSATFISKLPKDHYVWEYVHERHIPVRYWGELIYDHSFKNTPQDERLVFPLFSRDNELFGMIGRKIGKDDNRPKYMTWLFDKTIPSLWGMGKVDFSKPIIVFEGIIDAMFINNSVAALSSGLMEKAESAELDKGTTILVYDNDYDNPEIVRQIRKAIWRGWKIGCWVNKGDGKDINELVMKYGKVPEGIIEVKLGLQAILWLEQWKECE